MSEKRAYGSILARTREGTRRSDLAAVLQISEAGIGQLADAKTIAVERIHANPDQPRRAFVDATLLELADSIRARGVLQPIRVRRDGDGFQIVAGERRFRAAQLAGLRELPAVVVDQDEDDAYVDSLIENVQREDLNPIDRAEALRRLRVNLGLQSWEEVGAVLGLSRQSVHNLLGLTDLPQPIQEDLRSGGLTEKHGRALRQLNRRPELQGEAYRRIVDDGLSGDESLALVRSLRRLEVSVDLEATPSPAVAAVRELERLVAILEERLDEPLHAAERRDVRSALGRVGQRVTMLRSRLAD
jgi:ParB family transcriptional regulator, chromosome partitioning protein